jgi:hypothetical protein
VTSRFEIGDTVKDTFRRREGTVRRMAMGGGVVELQAPNGYTWRAVADKCVRVQVAPPPTRSLPGHLIPVTATPYDVMVGDWVRLEDGNAYEVRDMRAAGAGGRVLHLADRPRPWVMPTGTRTVYRPAPRARPE